MDRRKFLKNLSIVGAVPILINSFPLNVLGGQSLLNKLFTDSENDNILVLVQLHGGNDGLNTFVPLNQYSEYYNLRANVALPYSGKRKILEIDKNLPENQQLGLHPEMFGIKTLFDEGSATVVQNVGYENYNMSHFRSRDIMFMGGGVNDDFESGWIGRYLNHQNSGYPTGYPSTDKPDPLALELGNSASLAFHRATGINMGLSLASPKSFYDLISGVGINPPTSFPDSYYGSELEYIMQMELQANSYAEQLKYIYDKGSNASGVEYPEYYPLNAPSQFKKNHLSEQFKILAKLISGGSKTKIYIIRMGGFDTHADQVESYDNSLGRHAALLYHFSSSVKAFYDDLKQQGLDEKVVTMSFSEFGRRVYSNGSYGTDHGKAAPVMLFGSALKGGIEGNNPDLNNLDNGNLKYQIDYRRIYTSLLVDWLGADSDALEATNFGEFVNQKIDLFGESDTKNTNLKNSLNDCFPNPVSDKVTFSFDIKDKGRVQLYISSQSGKKETVCIDEYKNPGSYSKEIDISHLKTGIYIYSLIINNEKITKKLSKL